MLVNDTRPACGGSLVFSLEALTELRGEPFGMSNRQRSDFTECVTALVEDRELVRKLNATQALVDFRWVLDEVAATREGAGVTEAGDALTFWALNSTPVELHSVLTDRTVVDCNQVR